MAPHQDDLAAGLQEAIKTTLVQLCKVGIVYQCELSIAGTIGVTVDKKRTILVHFDEKIDPCLPDTSAVVPSLRTQLNDTFANGVNANSTVAVSPSSGVGLNGLMTVSSSPPQTGTVVNAYPDLTNFTCQSASNTIMKNEAYSQTLPSSFPISIDIDSDSDSLCELGFDDDVIEVGPSTMVRKREVMWSGDNNSEAKTVNKCEIKSDFVDRLEMDAACAPTSVSDNTEPTSSDPTQEELPVMAAPLSAPPRLLIDKRLFLKKMSPEKPRTRTRLSAAKAARAAASAAASPATSLTTAASTTTNRIHEEPLPPSEGNKKQGLKPRVMCEVCGKEFTTHCLLEAHLVEAHDIIFSVIHGEMREIVHYSCKHCSKKFRYQATLDKHEFLHVADKPWKCRFCNNTYCYEESLQIHVNVHAGVLDCLICQKMYSTRKNLQKHIVYMHEMRRVRTGLTPKKPRLMAPLEDPDDEEVDGGDGVGTS